MITEYTLLYSRPRRFYYAMEDEEGMFCDIGLLSVFGMSRDNPPRTLKLSISTTEEPSWVFAEMMDSVTDIELHTEYGVEWRLLWGRTGRFLRQHGDRFWLKLEKVEEA